MTRPDEHLDPDERREELTRAPQSDLDRRLESTLRKRLDALGAKATLCPSEIARTVGEDDWRDLMEPTREAARRLVAEGLAEITQHGQVVDPAAVRGPIRVRPRRR